MATFDSAPRSRKGAIVGIDPFNPLASVIVFQYNPETLTRTLAARAAATPGEAAARGEALRLQGPPTETIRLDVDLDAADQLETGDPLAESFGVAPALASLEMLLYPKSALVIGNEVLAALGIIEVIPPEAPLTLLVWGAGRVLPVRITQFSVVEQAFDGDLNPILAKVTLGFNVLTYDDVGLASVGGALYLAQQIAKEGLATANGLAAVQGAVSGAGALALGQSGLGGP
jgi:hypothetical protein